VPVDVGAHRQVVLDDDLDVVADVGADLRGPGSGRCSPSPRRPRREPSPSRRSRRPAGRPSCRPRGSPRARAAGCPDPSVSAGNSRMVSCMAWSSAAQSTSSAWAACALVAASGPASPEPRRQRAPLHAGVSGGRGRCRRPCRRRGRAPRCSARRSRPRPAWGSRRRCPRPRGRARRAGVRHLERVTGSDLDRRRRDANSSSSTDLAGAASTLTATADRPGRAACAGDQGAAGEDQGDDRDDRGGDGADRSFLGHVLLLGTVVPGGRSAGGCPLVERASACKRPGGRAGGHSSSGVPSVPNVGDLLRPGGPTGRRGHRGAWARPTSRHGARHRAEGCPTRRGAGVVRRSPRR
jgi:hypothetical protein